MISFKATLLCHVCLLNKVSTAVLALPGLYEVSNLMPSLYCVILNFSKSLNINEIGHW